MQFKVDINAPSASGGIGGVIGRATNFLVFIAGALSIIFILYGAFQYVVSGGNPDATKRAKDTILYALIGLIVSAIAYAFVRYVLAEVV